MRDYECDMQGIVNNANYQHYMEHARHEFLLSAGKGFTDLRELGIECVVRRVDIEYRVSLRSKDIAVCRLYLRREGSKYVFYQDIYRKSDDKLCTRGKVESVATVNGHATRATSWPSISRTTCRNHRDTHNRPPICHSPFADEGHEPASRRAAVAGRRRHGGPVRRIARELAREGGHRCAAVRPRKPPESPRSRRYRDKIYRAEKHHPAFLYRPRLSCTAA